MDFSNILETDKAYLAAILDGEGCVGLYARSVKYGKSCSPQFAITSTSIDWLVALRSYWGNAGGLSFSKAKKKANCKPTVQWTVHGKLAQEIVREVYPYIQIKKGQADILLRFKMIGQGKRRSEQELNEQSQLLSEVRLLNRRGTFEYANEKSQTIN